MSHHPDAVAPVYVGICHRASLLYNFAALLLAVLAAHSAWSDRVDLLAVCLPLAFFAAAIFCYALHGYLRDTDNQLRSPHQLGHRTLPTSLLHGFMPSLCVAEIGGAVILLAGLLRTSQTIS